MDCGSSRTIDLLDEDPCQRWWLEKSSSAGKIASIQSAVAGLLLNLKQDLGYNAVSRCGLLLAIVYDSKIMHEVLRRTYSV